LTLRVLVDAHMVGARETGNETYIVNLLQGLSRLAGVECGAAIAPDSIPALHLPDVEFVPLRLSGNWMRLLYALPSACRTWRADILHVTYVGPFFAPCPTVVTVHDVAFRHYPAFFSPRDRLLFATLLPATLRRARAVITVSRHAQQEILRAYPYLAGKVHVTLEAAGTMFRPIGQEELHQSVCSRYGIHTEFVLAVGNIQPRKNLLRVVNAFAAIRQQRESIQLVIVGKAQWRSSAVYAEVQRLGLERDVVFTGYVPDEDLVLLYNAAQVFVFPSIYEGFGLPILEAMACGTPVVTSNRSSMPEVAGEAALLVDPYDGGAIAEAVSLLLQDEDLRRIRGIKGIEQAGRFSWTETARQTLGVYQDIVAARSWRPRETISNA
jgi:glycosyltransferase involved in cell wall biosynthesis